MKREFKAADGSIVEVDDELTLLGPHPDLSGCSRESEMDPRFAFIRPFHTVAPRQPDPQSMGPQPQPVQGGYDSEVDDPEYLTRFWGHK